MVALLFITGAVALKAADDTAPEFKLTDLKGNEITLADLKGKVIFLNFWATWCGPCRIEIPDFIEFYGAYKDKGAAIVGISVDRSENKVKEFVTENQINYPIVMATNQIMGDYQPGRFIPTTIIIDTGGNIVDKKVGVMDKETLEKYFKELSK